MESYKIENLSFAYPNRTGRALSGICLSINQGEFTTLCGKSGCGKTTLLRLLKPPLAPFGDIEGGIIFNGKPLSCLDAREQASQIGFVMQSPDNQIVTDKVWHELAFGLESLGYSTPEIRTRVSEMASFFGIQTWFHKNVNELSGGQKQLLNLASVMVMQPSVLILDEPTSQLDPIAAGEFLKTLEKINRELGTTVILTEHRLEDAFPISDRVVVMDNGKVIADAKPETVGRILKASDHDMYAALPSPMRIFGAVDEGETCPLNVREGRVWLERYAQAHPLNTDFKLSPQSIQPAKETVIELKDVWFRYEKNLPDVIKSLNVKIGRGELFSILGGNGTGKSTALSLISGLNTPYRGEVLIDGENILKKKDLYNGTIGVLPQNPQALFVKKTVYLDLMEILSDKKLSESEKEQRIKAVSALCRIDTLLESHPYDLSGGEQQRTALAKVLLQLPHIILLDEPTKGMDANFKSVFADIINELKSNSVTVVMVSHDIEFCAEYSDRCAMFFDGNITSIGTPGDFFAGKSFYTTSANRMARTLLPGAVLADEVIRACGGTVPPKKQSALPEIELSEPEVRTEKNIAKSTSGKISPARLIAGSIFVLMFVLTCIAQLTDAEVLKVFDFAGTDMMQLISIAEIAAALICLLPQKELGAKRIRRSKNERRLSGRTLTAAFLILLAIPLTICVGMFYLQDRRYYFISLLIILETMIPFCMVFESRKPQARELIVVSVLCAIAVSGRTAFFMLPQFKPVVALVITAGVCFGGETGFLVGAVTGFVSNFYFGQGPWTPWQMFAFGIIGFVAGVLFQKGFLPKTRAALCIFGAFAAFAIYGGIMNTATVLLAPVNPTAEMFITSYTLGIPYDLIHGLSTAFFLWFVSEPMIDKLERIKIKYGLIER